MAPAAQHHHRWHRDQRAHTVTHGEHNATAIYEMAAPSPSPSLVRTASFSRALALSLSLSLSLPCAPLATSTPTAAESIPAASTTSKYPRPSPPSFLYPDPIVPPQVYSHTMHQDYAPGPLCRSLAHEEHCAISTLPAQMWLATLILVVVTVAGTWAGVVCMIHWRGVTSRMRQTGVSEGEGARGGWSARGSRWWGTFAKKGRYEVVRGEEEEKADGTELNTAMQASAHRAPTELHDRGSGSGRDASPMNPYLVPPNQRQQPSIRKIKPRGSREWAEEHRAFFQSSTSPAPSVTCSRTSSAHRLVSGTEQEDVESEAREAQGRRASLMRDGTEGNRSWVDLGLAAVDEAVDRFAAKVVRWTDDQGRDEALVLPLAKGKHN